MPPKGYKHTKIDTHCIKGHEFTEDNTYTPPGTTKRVCRACCSERSVIYNKKNRCVLNKRRREWRKNFETKAMRREQNLKHAGWTSALFYKVLKKQKGLCSVCKKKLTFEDKITGSRACADHKHVKPPMPRGILCSNCNLGIGNLQDDPKILRSALKYLGKFQ